MKTSFRTTLLALATTAALAATLAVSTAQAATATGSLTVKIVITESCTFGTSTDVDFGTQVRNTPTLNATGALSVTCSSGTPYSVTLNNGANFASSSRRMANAGTFIPYALSSVSAGGAAFTSVGGTGNGSAQSLGIFGQVLAPNVAAGSYSDTVVATITY